MPRFPSLPTSTSLPPIATDVEQGLTPVSAHGSSPASPTESTNLFRNPALAALPARAEGRVPSAPVQRRVGGSKLMMRCVAAGCFVVAGGGAALTAVGAKRQADGISVFDENSPAGERTLVMLCVGPSMALVGFLSAAMAIKISQASPSDA